jgi:hypothetical protein
VRPPGGARPQAGLERRETYTVHAERLELDSEDLRIEAVGAGSDETVVLEVSEGSPLVKVSRVLLVEGKRAAQWSRDYLVSGQTLQLLRFPEARRALSPLCRPGAL